jgi:release factor glutamine methyltransferase
MERFGMKKENVNLILSDISKDALEVAKKNVEKFGLDDICKLIENDLLNNVQTLHCNVCTNDYTKILVANLPYVGIGENNFLDENVKKYEPAKALFAGEDGLDLYRKLFEQIKCSKMDFDIMAFEFGYGQKRSFENLIKKNFPDKKYKFYKDLAGIWRGVIVRAEN